METKVDKWGFRYDGNTFTSTKMAVADTQHVSSTLYLYLCQNIVGTEDHIRTIRMMNNVRDNLASNKNIILISSGSFGEGLDMRGSDLDIMFVHKYFEVCEGAFIDFKPDTMYFAMATEDTQPCFTLLRLVHNGRFFVNDLQKVGDDYFFSSATFRQSLINEFFPTDHGPCFSDKDGLFDFTRCLHCKTWVPSACQWITRPNNSWPTYEVKRSIIKHGVMFVPIGVKGSTKEDLEWRMSFSFGEKLLVYTFTHTQLLCYALMKILLKDVINAAIECKDLLCSYFLKTILFWLSEELPTSIWKPENLISCFMRYFRRLVYCVQYSVCPHYFIPDNNLFGNKIQGKAQKIILNQLYILNSYGWQCIMFSDQIPTFCELRSQIHTEPCYLNIVNVNRFLHSNIHVIDYCLPVNPFRFEKGINMVLSVENVKIKYIYLYYMSKICYLTYQFPRFQDTPCNKASYKQYNNCVSILLLHLLHDSVSGWLKLASFFYQRKQYNKALVIIQYSVMKFTPEKLYTNRNAPNMYYELLNMPLFRKMTIFQLWKYLLLECIVLTKNSTVTPGELQIQGYLLPYTIPVKVYADFLCFLCHYHLENITERLEAIRNLELTIHENFSIVEPFTEATSFTILGIAFQLIGEKESARVAFMQSTELEPDRKINCSFERLLSID